jgi:transglutaminase-like putative cysteine protease
VTFNRRELLKHAAGLPAVVAFPNIARAQSAFAPAAGAWRTFQIVTRVEIDKPGGTMQTWLPLPSVNEVDWFRSCGNEWKTNAKAAQVKREAKYGALMLHVEWADSETAPVVEVTSRVMTRDRAVDLGRLDRVTLLAEAERAFYLKSTDLIPTDGIVKETAAYITANARTEIDKARAIYQWIVDHTFRDANVRGCGVGDVAAMLKTGNLGGKCADLNALFVGLARASDLPARDIYGVRVAPSKFGYKSLGANSEIVSKAQHCRAEVYLTGIGWIPVDPADVRKVMLEEPPGSLGSGDAKVAAVRSALFGAWEGNWLAYNMAHDVSLPGAKGSKVGFLMYPQAEIATARLDCLDPDTFKYTIKASEVPV